MWLYSSGRGSPPVIVYNYQTTRASKHPVRFLTGYSGLLQIDGYQGYNKLRHQLNWWAVSRTPEEIYGYP
jgi:hypothetical protein